MNLFLDSEGRLRSSWRFLLFVLLYLSFFFVLGWGISFLLTPLPVSWITRGIAISVAAGLGSALLVTAMLLGAVEQRTFGFVGLGLEPGWPAQLGAGAAIGFAMMSTIVLLEWATGHLRIAWSGESVVHIAQTTSAFLLIFFLGAMHEELVFRGYPFQRLLEVVGKPVAVLLMGAAFGAVHYANPHGTITGSLNTALVGVFFAVAYLRTGRLWLPIGIHWSWNFFEAAYGLPVSGITIEQMPLAARAYGRELFHGGAYGPEASLVATGVLTAAILLMLARRDANPERGSTV